MNKFESTNTPYELQKKFVKINCDNWEFLAKDIAKDSLLQKKISEEVKNLLNEQDKFYRRVIEFCFESRGITLTDKNITRYCQIIHHSGGGQTSLEIDGIIVANSFFEQSQNKVILSGNIERKNIVKLCEKRGYRINLGGL